MKARGIPAAVIMLFSIAFNKLYNKIKSFFVLANFGSCGNNVNISTGVVFRNPAKINLDSNISIDTGTVFKTEFSDGWVKIGEGTTIGKDVLIDFSGGMTIGKNVMISEGVITQTHDHGYEPKSIPQRKPLLIEDSAWLATRSIILSSVDRIGKNSIIAAGAIVTSDVPDNCIVGGNPAKVIGHI